MTSFLTEGKNRPLFCSREGNKERSKPLKIARCMCPPSLIIKAHKDNCVVLKTFAFVDGHHGDLGYPFKGIQTTDPVSSIRRRCKVQMECLLHNG